MADANLKQNLQEPDIEVVDKNDDSSQEVIEQSVNRPPKPPGPALGPYYQFLTTDLEKMLWMGSVLIFRHVSFDQPKVEFTSEAKVEYDWELLYENLFDMRAYRINLYIELRKGNGDENINWQIDWGDYSTSGLFHIAQYDQKWRGAFFSCNGFDATVSKEVAKGLTYNTVWKHLHSVHEESPLHILLWGGDQNYNDFVLEDVPFLNAWSIMEWDQKWTWEFGDESKKEVEEYYFNNYAEHWERRPEMKKALGSVPSVMMWDDHDIFDGAGSYPPLLHDSPIMMGLFEIAQKMRLLFQHHTTPDQARKHQFFGYQGHNFLARCGPNLAVVGADGRTERDEKTVQHEKTWDIMFETLDNDLQGVKHLIVLFPVPFSFARFKMAESLLESWKKITMRWRNIPLSEQTNSVFGLPELYDDLLDEWTHEAHMDERNRVLFRFQELAHKKTMRITFFSGDVHCCGVSRFRTWGENVPLPINDTKLMYQVISSAIVNRPPPRIVIRAAHFFGTKWYPINNTEEELINFFDRAPENGARLFLKKLLPNRNWCYFEQCSAPISTVTTVAQTRFLGNFVWPLMVYILSLIGLGSMFSGKNEARTHRTSYKPLSSHPTTDLEQETNNLKVRFWLENNVKKKGGPPFTSYELFIPELK